MVIPYLTIIFKSTNTVAIVMLLAGSTTRFNSRQYLRLYSIWSSVVWLKVRLVKTETCASGGFQFWNNQLSTSVLHCHPHDIPCSNPWNWKLESVAPHNITSNRCGLRDWSIYGENYNDIHRNHAQCYLCYQAVCGVRCLWSVLWGFSNSISSSHNVLTFDLSVSGYKGCLQCYSFYRCLKSST